MSKPTEYLLTRQVVATLEETKPTLDLLRLFHACYAYIDRNPAIQVASFALPSTPACAALCADLGAITGSPRAKSNAWMKSAVLEGDWRSLFSELALDGSGRILRFKFSRRVAEGSIRLKGDEVFAIVDSDVIRTISSVPEILFYTKATMVARADFPLFHLPNICPREAPWTDSSKKTWARVAARVGKRLGQHYLLVPERDPLTREVVRVKVKVVTGQSRWSPEHLYPRPPCAPVVVVHDGRFRSLTQPELIARRGWTRVICP